jgi:hypothetical protein
MTADTTLRDIDYLLARGNLRKDDERGCSIGYSLVEDAGWSFP